MNTPFSKLRPIDKFRTKWNAAGYGHEIEEYPFHEDRKWRFDFAWPDLMVAVEIDGFGWGHQAQQNISADNEKRNAAAEDGWTVLVYDSRLLGSHEKCEDAVDQVCRILERKAQESPASPVRD